MKKTILSLLMISMSFGLFAQVVSDQLNPLMTGVPSLTIAPDAVSGGMGDVGAATSADLYSQYWNSSKYAMAESSAGFAISYTPWLRSLGVSDIDLAYLCGYYQISEMAGTLGASLRYFSLGEVQLRESPDATPISVKPYELAFDLGYSRKLSEQFAMGVVMRFIASDLSAKTDENYYTGYAFSADINGIWYLPIDLSMGESRFGLGFNISNIGTKISYDKGETSNFLPANLRLCVSYLLPFNEYNRILFSVDANKLMVPSRLSRFTDGFEADNPETWAMSQAQYNDISVMKGIAWSFCDAPRGFKEEFQEVNWAIGLEYAYNEQFFGRAGYFNDDASKGNRKYFTVGSGFRLSAFKFYVG